MTMMNSVVTDGKRQMIINRYGRLWFLVAMMVVSTAMACLFLASFQTVAR
jgi:hypothetical protein